MIVRVCLFISFVVIFAIPRAVLSQPTCCDSEGCREKAERLSGEISDALAALRDDPDSYEAREKKIDSLKVINERQYLRITTLIRKINDFNRESPAGLNCIYEFIEDEDVIDWMAHFFLKQENVKGHSPEFCGGFGLHSDLNTGVADLFRNSEAFSSSFRVLLAYSFPKNKCGGKVRFLLGPSLYYQDRKAIVMVNPRAEFRLTDIGNDLVSIGNLKLIGQANFNANTLIAGLGLGIEVDNFGAQVVGEYQSGFFNYSIQTGLFYRFRL